MTNCSADYAEALPRVANCCTARQPDVQSSGRLFATEAILDREFASAEDWWVDSDPGAQGQDGVGNLAKVNVGARGGRFATTGRVTGARRVVGRFAFVLSAECDARTGVVAGPCLIRPASAVNFAALMVMSEVLSGGFGVVVDRGKDKYASDKVWQPRNWLSPLFRFASAYPLAGSGGRTKGQPASPSYDGAVRAPYSKWGTQ